MTSAQVVETLVTNNSSFQNYTHSDDHTIPTIIVIIVLIIDVFKKFILKQIKVLYYDLHNYQGVEQKSSIAEDTFPVETNTHCRVLCHLMSRRVLDRKDICPQQRSEHRGVQTLYTDSDNDMSRRYRDPSLAKKCEIKNVSNYE